MKRLLVHIRNNIFHYMQAIWTMEPPDQRFLRLYKVRVPVLELESRSYRVTVEPETDDIFAPFREPGTEKHKAFLHGTLKHNAGGGFDTKSLVEVADLDTVLGFKGNYMIFPMKEHNALTEFMAAPYVDSAFGAMDPDQLANVNLEEYSRYVCCLHDTMEPADFAAIKEQLREWLEKLLATSLRNGDEIVVPTGALFIEALVDENSNLENFKLMHRDLDVYKVEQEVRKAGLENLRLAARLLNEERGIRTSRRRSSCRGWRRGSWWTSSGSPQRRRRSTWRTPMQSWRASRRRSSGRTRARSSASPTRSTSTTSTSTTSRPSTTRP